MSRTQVVLGPFLGAVTSVDKTAIPENKASDLLNCRIEDGTLAPRYGFRQNEAPQGGFVASYGYEYLEGFSGTTQLSEFISFEDIGSGVRPYHRTGGGAAVQEITIGAGHATLDPSPWRAVAWQDKAYLFNPLDTQGCYRYNLGTYSSLIAINKVADPTQALTYTVVYGGSKTPYTQFKFTGITTAALGDIVYSGLAQATNSAVNSDGSITIGHSNGTGAASVAITLDGTGPGQQDWRFNDAFAFTVTVPPAGYFQIDPLSIQVLLINANGDTLTPSGVAATSLDQSANPGAKSNGIRVEFYDKTRTDFQHIKQIVIAWNVKSYDAGKSFTWQDPAGTHTEDPTNNELRISPWWVGGVKIAPDAAQSSAPNHQSLIFGYTYSTGAGETGIGGRLDVPLRAISGYSPIVGLDPLGVQVQFTAPFLAGATTWSLYALDPGDTPIDYRQIVTQAAANPNTYTLETSYAEWHRLSAFHPPSFVATGITCAVPFKGWMVWGYKGGYHNIRHSYVGDPEHLHSVVDDIQQIDLNGNVVPQVNIPADYSMADNFGDSPIALHACGDALISVGSIGVYGQVGDTPSSMTASKLLPGSFGCPAPFASCKWKDEFGNPGVAAISRGGEGVYFYAIDRTFDGQTRGYRVTELTQDVRPSIRTFLGTTLTNAHLVHDEANDALWIIAGRRAMVYRRIFPITGERHWEFYEYTMGGDTIAYPVFNVRWGTRWMRSSGAVDLVERDLNLNPLTGTGRDNGTPISSIYWQSKLMTSPFNGRIDAVYSLRDDLTNTPTMQVISSRQTETRTWASGKRHVRFGPLQQGWEHQFKISISENDSAYRRFVVDVLGPIGRRVLN